MNSRVKRAAETAAGWVGGAIFIAVLIAISVLVQIVNDTGQEAGGIIGFLTEWFVG